MFSNFFGLSQGAASYSGATWPAQPCLQPLLDLPRSYCTPLLSSACHQPLDCVAINFIDVLWASRLRQNFRTFCLKDWLVEGHLRVVVHDDLDGLVDGDRVDSEVELLRFDTIFGSLSTYNSGVFRTIPSAISGLYRPTIPGFFDRFRLQIRVF